MSTRVDFTRSDDGVITVTSTGLPKSSGRLDNIMLMSGFSDTGIAGCRVTVTDGSYVDSSITKELWEELPSSLAFGRDPIVGEAIR